MASKYEKYEDGRPVPKRHRGWKNVEKRLSAQEILRRLEWTSHHFVYWTGGENPAAKKRNALVLPPATRVVEDRLRGLPAGLYTVRLRIPGPLKSSGFAERGMYSEDIARLEPILWSHVNPEVQAVVPLTEKLLAGSVTAINASHRYPRALPRLVPDVHAWRDRQGEAVRRVRRVLDAGKVGSSAEPLSLELERFCFWIGDDARRPSRRMAADLLLERFEEAGKNPTGAEARHTALLAGWRGLDIKSPASLEPWVRCGRVFRAWPPDVLWKAVECLGTPGNLLAAARENDAVRRAEYEGPVSEILLLSDDAKEALGCFLGGARLLEEARRRIQAEPGRLFSLLTRAVQDVFDRIDEVGVQYARRKGARDALIQIRDMTSGGEDPESGDGLYEGPTIESVKWSFFHEYLEAVEDVEYPDRLRKRLSKPSGCSSFLQQLFRAQDDLCKTFFGVSAGCLWNDEISRPLARGLSVENHRERFVSLIWRLGESAIPPDLTADFPRVLLLVARIMSRNPRREVLKGATDLIDAYRARFFRLSGEKEASVLEGALKFLLHGSARLGISSGRIPDFLAVLLHDFHAFFRACPVRGLSAELADSWDLEEVFRIDIFPILQRVCRLLDAGQPVEVCRRVVSMKLDRAVEHFLNQSPQRLLRFLDHIKRTGKADETDADAWAVLYASGNEGLISLLEEGVKAIVSKRDDRNSLLSQIYNLCIYEETDLAGFLSRNPWLLEEMFTHVRHVLEAQPDYKGEKPIAVRAHCESILMLAFHWSRRDYGNLRKFVAGMIGIARDSLLKRTKSGIWLTSCGWRPTAEILTGLSRGCVQRGFMLAAGQPSYPPGEEYRVLNTWKWLDRHPRVQEFLSRFAATRELGRALRWMVRADLVDRLDRAALGKELAEWASVADRPFRKDPGRAAADFPEVADPIRELSGYGEWMGRGPELPKSMRRILERPQRLRGELETLRKLGDEAGGAARLRAAKLERTLDDEEGIHRWVVRDLEKILQKHLDEIRMAALEKVASGVVNRHLADILGVSPDEVKSGPDWDRAVELYYSTRKNRRILKRLLLHEHAGDRSWIREHGANRAFIDRMRERSVDMESWLGDMSRRVQVGGEVWTLYLESDPLRVLQMGSLFDTCIALDAVNAFSVVANAVEVNKRVLYVADGQGAIVGRKLLALTGEGHMIGFGSYGAGMHDSRGRKPWMKIHMDLFCRALADRCRVEMDDTLEIDPQNDFEETLSLFARGYLDPPEPFDSYLTRVSPGELHLEIARRGPTYHDLIRDLLVHRSGTEVDPALRALIWLGDRAQSVLSPVLDRGHAYWNWKSSPKVTHPVRQIGVKGSHLEDLVESLRFIEHHTESASVKRMLSKAFEEKAWEANF